MRVGKQPALLKLLHHPADRRWRQVNAGGERLRSDRHAALKIRVDHQAGVLRLAIGVEGGVGLGGGGTGRDSIVGGVYIGFH